MDARSITVPALLLFAAVLLLVSVCSAGASADGGFCGTDIRDSASVIQCDTEPPVIEHVPPEVCRYDAPLTVRCEVRDDNGVTGVYLKYRTGGDDRYALLAMDGDGPDYEATIPRDTVTEDRVEYFIFASDGTNVGTYGTYSDPVAVGTDDTARDIIAVSLFPPIAISLVLISARND